MPPTVYKTFMVGALWSIWLETWFKMNSKNNLEHGGSCVITKKPLTYYEMFNERAEDLELSIYGENEQFQTSTILVL